MEEIKTLPITDLEQHIKDGCKFYNPILELEIEFIKKEDYVFDFKHKKGITQVFYNGRIIQTNMYILILVKQKKYTKEEIVEIFTSYNEENDIMRFIGNNFE